MVTEKFCASVRPELSATVAVKDVVPGNDGTPLSTPASVSVNPAGRYLLNDSGIVEGRTEAGGRDETAALEHF